MPCGRFCTAEATLTRASTRQSHSYGSPAVDHRGFNVWGTPGSWENESFIPVLLRQPSTGPHSQHRCSVTRGAGGVEPVLRGVAAAPRCGQPHPPRVSQPAAPTEAAARCAQRFQRGVLARAGMTRSRTVFPGSLVDELLLDLSKTRPLAAGGATPRAGAGSALTAWLTGTFAIRQRATQKLRASTVLSA